MIKLIIISMILFLTSCSTSSSKYLKNYDNTNPIKIEESISGLNIDKLVPKLTGTIAIRSIELNMSDRLDVGVGYMIEDNLITQLINKGFKVLERDPDALSNIYRESFTNYRKNNPQFDLIFANQNIQEKDKESVNVVNVNLSDQIEAKLIADNTQDELVKTELNSSDYLLTYRVLECGIVYSALDNEVVEKRFDIEDIANIQRNARTRLHCRLTNTKTSEIIAAGIVENEVVDVVKKEDILDLEQISYEYYHHTLPNQNLSGIGLTEDSGYAFVGEKRSIEQPFSKFTNNNSAIPLTLGILYLAYVIGGQ
tara:strand:- start:66 stop:998 length:933 start_codon:yes stop_codon:yes gene_type:complete